MKCKIDRTAYDKMDAAFQAEYSQDGDDFILTLDGAPDTGALKRAKDHEKERRQKAEAELVTVKATLTEKEDELIDIRKGVIPKDDVDALETSWKKKMDDQKADYETRLTESEGSLTGLLVDSVANRIAGDISTVPSLMAESIKQRLTTEIVDGKRVTRVLDAAGKPSALTIEELQKEIVANPTFAPIIVGSKASGSGANGGGSNNGSAKTFSGMSESERVSLFREDPNKYRSLRDQEQSA